MPSNSISTYSAKNEKKNTAYQLRKQKQLQADLGCTRQKVRIALIFIFHLHISVTFNSCGHFGQ